MQSINNLCQYCSYYFNYSHTIKIVQVAFIILLITDGCKKSEVQYPRNHGLVAATNDKN